MDNDRLQSCWYIVNVEAAIFKDGRYLMIVRGQEESHAPGGLALVGDLYAVDLICDADVQPFYARLGMRPALAMMVRNYARQSGCTGS